MTLDDGSPLASNIVRWSDKVFDLNGRRKECNAWASQFHRWETNILIFIEFRTCTKPGETRLTQQISVSLGEQSAADFPDLIQRVADSIDHDIPIELCLIKCYWFHGQLRKGRNIVRT